MNLKDSEDLYNEIIQLENGNEFRFIIDTPTQKVILQLIEGTAELYGSELYLHNKYEFSYFSAVTIYTWHGCTIKLKTNSSKRCKYKIKASNFISKIRDLHDYLEGFRINAERNNSACPVALIAGPTDVGKSTLCRFLLNYANRHGRKPVFVDLDVGQSSLSITGTFGVLPVNGPTDENGNFDENTLSVYYFGYKSPSHHMLLYKLLLEKLGSAMKVRLRNGSNDLSSGVIIDTCGWVDGGGYNLILKIIESFNVNIIFVIGKKPVYYKLMNDISETINIKYIPRLDGVVTRNKTVRLDNRNSSIYKYFYGLSRPVQPYIIKVGFLDIEIYKANSKHIKLIQSNVKNSNVIAIQIEPKILYQIFGLSYAENVEDIPFTSVYGFVCIIDLDMDSKIASILSPQPAPLPTKYLLMGDIVMPEDMIS